MIQISYCINAKGQTETLVVTKDCIGSGLIGLKLQIPVVTAEQLGVGRGDGSAASIDNQLQDILVHLHHNRGHFLGGHEEDDGEKSDLKLWTDTDEGATDGFHQAFPAELQAQHVVVLIRLSKKNIILEW